MVQQAKCPKCLCPMEEVLTRKGVLIDTCPLCQGVWLDSGELNFFTKNKKVLLNLRTKTLQSAKKISALCPKCSSATMEQGRFSGFFFQVEKCRSCQGLFLDKPEFQKLSVDKHFLSLQKDRLISQQNTENLDKTSATSSGHLNRAKKSQYSEPKALKSMAYFPLKIPSLFLTTGMVCLGLYGLLFIGMVFLVEVGALSLLSGVVTVLLIVLAQFYFGPFIMDWYLKRGGSVTWVDLTHLLNQQDTKNQSNSHYHGLTSPTDVPQPGDPHYLPPYFTKALFNLCKKNRIPLPKMGIIHDQSPQAYTYGRTPKSARLVFSKGIFELLDPEESTAVLAHELGHIKHWDFVIMTLIRIIPLIFYTVYKSTRDSLKHKRTRKNKKGDITPAVMVVSYVLYRMTEYLVLFVSRVREYHADRFSAFATKKPNKLLTALVKIAYGLLAAPQAKEDTKSASPSKKQKNKQEWLKGVEALNIMSVSRSKQLALASQGEGEQFNPQTIQSIMRWDLWSPWAFYYELHSTHPLTAKRINALGSYALSLQQEPFLRFKKVKPESYWDDFFADVFVLFLPYIIGIGCMIAYFISFSETGFSALTDLWGPEVEGAKEVYQKDMGKGFTFTFTQYPMFKPLMVGLLGGSIGAFLRLMCAYPGGSFVPHSVASLLKMIKVSPVRSYPVLLEGHILGRGEAGDLFSEDMVLRDKTGMLYLNHEPFGLNFLWAFLRYDKFKGQKVQVTGWYRRSPSPYLEVKNIQTTKGVRSKAYTYYYKMAFCVIGIVLPLLYFLKFQ